MKNTTLCYALVIPLRRVPERFEILTYSYMSTEPVQTGDFVEIPFGKNMLFGLVIGQLKQKPSFTVKDIKKITPYRLSTQTLSLINSIKKIYGGTYNHILQLIVNEELLKQLNKKSIHAGYDNLICAQENNLALTPIQKPQHRLYIEKTSIDRGALLKKSISPLGTTLLLVPEQYTLEKIHEELIKNNVEHVVYYGEIKANKRAEIWHKALCGERQIILATRIGVFLPFKELRHIIIIDEDNEAYTELHKPSYHAPIVAQILASLYQANVTTITPAPLFETWLDFHLYKKEYGAYQLTKSGNPIPTVHIISMTEERKSGFQGAISDAALKAIAGTLARNKQVLLFINRRGVAGVIICKDCASVFICVHCENILTLHEKFELRCHRCGYTSNTIIACQKCGSLERKSYSLGTQGLEKVIKNTFEKAHIVRLDSDTVSGRKKIKTALDSRELNEADIIIATQIINKPLDVPRLVTSIAICPDVMLQFPHFRAQEKAFQILSRLKINTKETFIIQSYLPELPIYRAIVEGDASLFFKNEHAVRMLLKLPPFE